MTYRFASAMRRTTAAMRSYNTMGATRMIQAALARSSAKALDRWSRQTAETPQSWPTPEPASKPARAQSRSRRAATEPAPGGVFATRSFACKAGTRAYKLYVPARHSAAPRGLIIMLHGCTQNPDDFAAGTRMNVVAEDNGLIVAYPAQTRAHNASGCWNWFQTGDQQRDKGEPAILAGMARELMAEFDLARDQVFVAGLSAGGAMAVIMAETYPDVFSAVGVHSGMPYQSASNVMSALTAMRGRVGGRSGVSADADPQGPAMRTIVFHGSADRTVHPVNADGIVVDAMVSHADATTKTEAGLTNGKRFTRTVVTGADGRPNLENWTIEGAGHAWSGGSRAGTFADPLGPDASGEMVRFFLAQSPAD
jgi:poly(hydroxyalkanoate) depolymerase family esterase